MRLSRRACLCVQTLEARDVPAGNITATLVGEVLILTGDDAANGLTLMQAPSQFVLTPDATTSVNGAGPGIPVVMVGRTTGLRATMQGGADQLSLDSSRTFGLWRPTVFDMGDGDNVLSLLTDARLTFGSLAVKCGDGFDTVTIRCPVGLDNAVTGPAKFSYGLGGSVTQLDGMDFRSLAGLAITAGEGDDAVQFTGAETVAAVTLALGNGSNDLDVVDSHLRSVVAAGYAMPDSTWRNSSVFTGGLTYRFTGDVRVNFDTFRSFGPVTVGSVQKGSNANTFWFGTNSISALTVTGGDDANAVLTGGAKLRVTRDVTLTAGHDDAQLVLNDDTELTARNVAVRSLRDDAVLRVDTPNATQPRLAVTGNLAVAAGGSAFLLQTAGATAVTGAVAVTAGEWATVELTAGAELTAKGDMRVAGSAGGATVQVSGSELRARSLAMTGTSASDEQAADAAGAPRVILAGGLTAIATVDRVRFSQTAGDLEVTDGMTLTGRHGAVFTHSEANTTTAVGGRLAVGAGQNGMIFNVLGQSLLVGGDTTLTAATAIGAMLGTRGISEFGGNVTVRGGGGGRSETFTSTSNVRYAKDLTIAVGDGGEGVNLLGQPGIPTVGGELTITTGAGNDIIFMHEVSVAGPTRITTGAGADRLEIEQAAFAGPFVADLGGGDDTISIAQWPSQSAPVTFTGKATILAGAGNDTLRLGLALASGGDANSKAVFSAPGALIDGGFGLNTFDDEEGQFSGVALGTGIINWADPT